MIIQRNEMKKGLSLLALLMGHCYAGQSTTVNNLFPGHSFYSPNLTGTIAAGYGIYAYTTQSGGVVNINGLQNNAISLGAHSTGIYAFAQATGSSIHIKANLAFPNITPSQANDGTSYAMKGAVSPKA